MSKCRILLPTVSIERFLMAQYPDKKDMGWPTYIICESPDADFKNYGRSKRRTSKRRISQTPPGYIRSLKRVEAKIIYYL